MPVHARSTTNQAAAIDAGQVLNGTAVIRPLQEHLRPTDVSVREWLGQVMEAGQPASYSQPTPESAVQTFERWYLPCREQSLSGPATMSRLHEWINTTAHQVTLVPCNVDVIVPLHGQREKTVARLRRLKRLPADHDNEGAAAPDEGSVDQAIAFVSSATSDLLYHATVSDDGLAVLEFEDRAMRRFASMTFHADGQVDFYRSFGPSAPTITSDLLRSNEMRTALRNFLGVHFAT